MTNLGDVKLQTLEPLNLPTPHAANDRDMKDEHPSLKRLAVDVDWRVES